MKWKQAFINNGNRIYNFGTDENPKLDESSGYADMADFMKWHPNAELLAVHQEQTGATIDRKFYIYKIFYKESP